MVEFNANLFNVVVNKEKEARECLAALLEVEKGIDKKSLDFIDSVSKREEPLTSGQRKWILDLYDTHC